MYFMNMFCSVKHKNPRFNLSFQIDEANIKTRRGEDAKNDNDNPVRVQCSTSNSYFMGFLWLYCGYVTPTQTMVQTKLTTHGSNQNTHTGESVQD